MDNWKGTVESWLLDCSAASAGSPQSNGTNGTILKPSLDAAEHLNQQQTEQLIAACPLTNEKLLLALFTLFEEKNR